MTDWTTEAFKPSSTSTPAVFQGAFGAPPPPPAYTGKSLPDSAPKRNLPSFTNTAFLKAGTLERYVKVINATNLKPDEKARMGVWDAKTNLYMGDFEIDDTGKDSLFDSKTLTSEMGTFLKHKNYKVGGKRKVRKTRRRNSRKTRKH